MLVNQVSAKIIHILNGTVPDVTYQKLYFGGE